MLIIGISAFYHDSAAAIIRDGEIIAAAQEERFTRVKHDQSFPMQSIAYCLLEANANLCDVDYVVFYDKPFLKFERLVESYLAFAPKGFDSFRKSIPVWLKDKLFQKANISKFLSQIDPKFDPTHKLKFSEHHLSHAASAFFPSPFESAAIITLDGVGEWTSSSISIGNKNRLDICDEIHFPHSIGLLYSAFTYYCGFKVNSGEYKLMGLAPYGSPIYTNQILNNLIDLKEDGSFRLDMSYFDYCVGLRMVNNKFCQLFGKPARNPEDLIDQFYMDIAASIQAITELVMLRITSAVREKTGLTDLCLAGGVALNCVANGKIARSGKFNRIWIQAAAGDAGGAIGAALAMYHNILGHSRTINPKTDGMSGSYLGPNYSNEHVIASLKKIGANFTTHSDEEILHMTTKALVNGSAIGWFQGRMEFGPRSLGNRSILGDARSPSMQKILNLKVKFRESFRPFAPAIPFEDLSNWFDLSQPSPYMLLVADVKNNLQIQMTESQKSLFGIDKLNIPKSAIPAVTHVDYSARIQTVHIETNPKFHALLKQFESETGCPVLVNTSFNVRGEPIVCTPEDAYRCFMGSGIDMLVIENCLLKKDDQPNNLLNEYKDKFTLD